MHEKTPEITELILDAKAKAARETGFRPEDADNKRVHWPVNCTVGPGLEGAIACETKIGYVDGTHGWLVYQGYDIFDLCAYSSFEEVSYLLLHGHLPTARQLERYKSKMVQTRHIPFTLRMLMGVPVEEMHPMAALRLASNLLRRRRTWRDSDTARPSIEEAIAADEDSTPMETKPMGEEHAIYEFRKKRKSKPTNARRLSDDAVSMDSCIYLISGLATITAGIARLREEKLPIEPDPSLSHAANFLYMMTGKKPSPVEERIMDVALILHADHGMNPSTFSTLVVASTMSDIYFSVGAGIAALNGPLHGGANEKVIHTLRSIGRPERAASWFRKQRRYNAKIPGFGHRLYKAYDPRARVLAPLADTLARNKPEARRLYDTALALEKEVVGSLGKEKGVFPNVDFFSGIIYNAMAIPDEMFTPIFAVSRVVGWTARVNEYLRNNRIFRPRAKYTGEFGKTYEPPDHRPGK